MSTPGWYPDPSGNPGLRYWDGSNWTNQTQPSPGSQNQPSPGPQSQPSPGPQLQPPAGNSNSQGGNLSAVNWRNQPQNPQNPQGQYPQMQSPAGDSQHSNGNWAGAGWSSQDSRQPQTPYGTPPKKGGNAPLWIALGLAVLLIVAIGGYLLWPKPGAQVAASPTPDKTTAAEETKAPSAEPTPTEEETTAAPAPVPEDGPSTVAVGDALKPLSCAGYAKDAVGEVDSTGRISSGAGFSAPLADGFAAYPVKYPWLHQSNSQLKNLNDDWSSAMSLGVLKADEGFKTREASTIRLARCLFGSGFYGDHFKSAEVTSFNAKTKDNATWLTVKVMVTGIKDVTYDHVEVAVVERGSTLHALIVVIPDIDKEGWDALDESMQDLSIKN